MAEEWKSKGNDALKAKNYDEAIECYTKAIELDGSNHVYYSNRSAAYLSKGDKEAALADGRKCVEVSPGWPKGYGRAAAALHALHRYDEAVQTYEAGLQAAPGDAALEGGLAEVRRAAAAGRDPLGGLFGGDVIAKLAAHPSMARHLADPDFVNKMRMIQANPQNLSLFMQSDPRIMEAFGALTGINLGAMPGGGGGGADDDERDFDAPPPPAAEPTPEELVPEPAPEEEEELTEEERAAAAAARAAERKRLADAKLAVAAKQRGNELYKLKDLDGALAAYEEAATLDPRNMQFLNNKAAVYFEKKDYAAVLATCDEAVAVGRAHRADYVDVSKAYIRKAKAYKAQGDWERACAALETAQVENYTKETERLLKHWQLDMRKAAAAAYVDPEKAVEAKERGNEHFRAGAFPEAAKEYEEAVKRDPTNAVYRNNLASAYTKLMDFNKAKEACEKALELDPQYVKAWAKKGDIEFFMKEYHKALDSYKKGLEFEPNNQLCTAGVQKTLARINQANQSGEMDQERAAHAMADPEIQAILSDPIIRNVLRDLQESPAAAQKALSDPTVAAKLEKLMAAGILQMR
uniref:Hsp70-Hsp90 organising protein n=1 Tax=Heterosigma akashiwo TaxID=2829 RepID=A0A7S3XT11_HETAK